MLSTSYRDAAGDVLHANNLSPQDTLCALPAPSRLPVCLNTHDWQDVLGIGISSNDTAIIHNVSIGQSSFSSISRERKKP